MIKNSIVNFKRGNILNQHMLEELQEFANRDIQVFYYGYSDGIIQGLDFILKDNLLFLTPGIVKFHGKYYYLEKEMEVLNTENFKYKKLYIYLVNEGIKEENNITVDSLKIKISEEAIEKDAIFLGFCSRQDLSVKITYKSLEDLNLPKSDIINIVERKYAGKSGPTISPTILNLFAQKMKNKKLTSPLEHFIFFKGLNKEIIEIDLLKEYLNYNGDSFMEIFKLLLKKKFDEKFDDTTTENHNENDDFMIL